MTNTELLRSKIEGSGLKVQFIAGKLGISPQGFYNKLNNKTEFRASEIRVICDLLHIGAKEKEAIFFAA